MAIVFRTNGAWGAGKGSPLTAAEVDNNFYELDQRVDDLEANPPEPNNIDNIQVVGSQMTITMEDYSTFGPFTLPIALFHWRGAWVADEDYSELDFFYVTGQGVYMVLQDHTSDAYGFDENAVGEDSSPLYHKLFGIPPFQTWYDFDRFIPGKPAAGAVVLRHVAPRVWTLPDDPEAVVANAGTAPTTIPSDYDVKKNGTKIGTLSVTDVSSTYTPEDAEVDFALDDVLSIEAPDPQDATAEDIAITVAGVKDNVGA